ncbi:hypothetical protein [Streptococcus sp. DD13]|uniref:hypothetical protein n=1 Tax=Streptococcus sp. DD13 TaxID=1777881 RepID=UPI00079BE9A7|nr:hypothetical protein [Streptococcus sp. DD13]KXT79230.1 hypothetical protein STRDD13_00054 [Streptococcus sp. DD13]
MKMKKSYLLYAIISLFFAGLSLWTDFFERFPMEKFYAFFGSMMGLLISSMVAIELAKWILKKMKEEG